MSDLRCTIKFISKWDEAFEFSKRALSRINALMNSSPNGSSYFFPDDGSDRRLFDLDRDRVEDGGIQFWLPSGVDIFVSWKYFEKNTINFSFDLKGKSLDLQGDIVRQIYLELVGFNQDLVGDGTVLSVCIFDE